jgi:hypothetical protein
MPRLFSVPSSRGISRYGRYMAKPYIISQHSLDWDFSVIYADFAARLGLGDLLRESIGS